jgi:amidase
MQFDELLDRFTDVWAAMVSGGVRMGELVAGRDATADDVEALTWALHEHALATPSSSYLRSLTILQRVARAAIEWSMQWDAVLTPALGARPLRVGELDTSAPDPMATFEASSRFTPFTPFVNVTGQPAISLPLHWSEEGLPIGVQLAAGFGEEDLLLRVAAQLEEARPWADRVPTAVAALD